MRAVPVTIELHPAREALVVAVSGEVDLFTAPQIRAAVSEAVAEGWTQLVLDMRGVTFMDGQGLRLLEDLRALEQQDVTCSLIDGAAAITRLCDAAGTGKILPPAPVEAL